MTSSSDLKECPSGYIMTGCSCESDDIHECSGQKMIDITSDPKEPNYRC